MDLNHIPTVAETNTQASRLPQLAANVEDNVKGQERHGGGGCGVGVAVGADGGRGGGVPAVAVEALLHPRSCHQGDLRPPETFLNNRLVVSQASAVRPGAREGSTRGREGERQVRAGTGETFGDASQLDRCT